MIIASTRSTAADQHKADLVLGPDDDATMYMNSGYVVLPGMYYSSTNMWFVGSAVDRWSGSYFKGTWEWEAR